jgi:hypothetical protein
MLEKGYSYFVTDPGTEDKVECRVCGTVCDVRRDVYGPTSWATALASDLKDHDAFVCPHADEDWHDQALELVHAIEDTPSKRVAELMKLDLEDILCEHTT